VSISHIEKAAMRALLSGEDAVLEVLRQQYAAASIVKRDLTGVGVFTRFRVPEKARTVRPPNFVIRDVNLDLAGVEGGVTAMLFVRDGRLDSLELCTWTGSWPEQPDLVGVLFERIKPGSSKELELDEERDLTWARHYWAG
jgi:hypothetical protein